MRVCACKAIVLCIMALCALTRLSVLTAQTGYFTVGGKSISVAAINRQIQTIQYETGIPAISLAVIDNNKVVFSNAYGYKEETKKNKIDQHTVFEACSLSKIFLLLVVHKLVDQGLFNLDTPMYRYMPYERLEHDARYKLITPRMILSHTSGIENWQSYNNPDTLEILSNPGEQFVYSGEGYEYLAKVIEKLLHKPYAAYITDMVLTPLQLKDTWLQYNSANGTPANYATGHSNFGEPVSKWKNLQPVPASGIHTVAADFARLLIAMFDKSQLSGNRIRDLLQPVLALEEQHAHFYMGAGFFMMYDNNDTIIAFSGNNSGFKAEMLYSTVHKRGLVFMTNSDRGALITKKLWELTAGLAIVPLYFEDNYAEQYPSTAFHLLKIFREKNAGAMFNEIEKLEKENKIGVKALNELGDLFMDYDKTIAGKLLKENTRLYPESPIAWGLLGKLYSQMNDYEAACTAYTKAHELKFDLWDLESELKKCRGKSADAAKRQPAANSKP